MNIIYTLLQYQNCFYFIFIITPIHLLFSFYFLKNLFIYHNNDSNAYKFLLDEFDNTPYYDIATNNSNTSLDPKYSQLKLKIFDQYNFNKIIKYYNNSFLTVLYNHQYFDYISYIISSDKECSGYRKKCGIFDTTNNILCLPLNEKCPINDIIIGNKQNYILKKIDNIKYNEFKLTTEISFFYTNEAINNSIIVDLLLSENGICAYPINRTYVKNGLFEHYCDERVLGQYRYNENYKNVNYNHEKTKFIEKYNLYVSNYRGVKNKCSNDLNGKKFIKKIKDLKNKNPYSYSYYFLFNIQLIFALIILINHCFERKFKFFLFFRVTGNVLKIFYFFYNCLIIIILIYFHLFNVYKVGAKKYFNCSDPITNEIIKESFKIPSITFFIIFTQFFVLILSNILIFLNFIGNTMYYELPNNNETTKIKYNKIVEITTLK